MKKSHEEGSANNMNVADRIQNLRKTKGISQEELADEIGVSRQAVSKWESEQSLPDIDKIIIMSEFFDVTTDYILKGIEPVKQEQAKKEKPLSGVIFVMASTPFIFIGLVAACIVWYQWQTPIALLVGLGLMAMGCMNFGAGWSFATQNKERALKLFWKINIWSLSFIPLSVVYNLVSTRIILAPYPQLEGSVFSSNEATVALFASFWVVYIAICLAVTFVVSRKNRKN